MHGLDARIINCEEAPDHIGGPRTSGGDPVRIRATTKRSNQIFPGIIPKIDKHVPVWVMLCDDVKVLSETSVVELVGSIEAKGKDVHYTFSLTILQT
jgi:hypothetical protein